MTWSTTWQTCSMVSKTSERHQHQTSNQFFPLSPGLSDRESVDLSRRAVAALRRSDDHGWMVRGHRRCHDTMEEVEHIRRTVREAANDRVGASEIAYRVIVFRERVRPFLTVPGCGFYFFHFSEVCRPSVHVFSFLFRHERPEAKEDEETKGTEDKVTVTKVKVKKCHKDRD